MKQFKRGRFQTTLRTLNQKKEFLGKLNHSEQPLRTLRIFSFLMALVIAWFLGSVCNIYYVGESQSLLNMYKQKLTIVRQLNKQRKLIIVGGSGAHKSVNSQFMQKELGIPVVNFGLDGRLGLNVILPIALNAVSHGDVVLLIPEDVILIDEDGVDYRSLPFSIGIGKPKLAYANPRQFIQDIWLLGLPGLKPLTKSILDILQEGRTTGYYSYPLTNNGDPTVDFVRPVWKRPVPKTISRNSIVKITRFRDQIEIKGASLIISLPWFLAKTDELSVSNMKDILRNLSQIAPVICDSETLNMQSDADFFADTEHHLTPQAKVIRSRQLVEQLIPFLKIADRHRASKI